MVDVQEKNSAEPDADEADVLKDFDDLFSEEVNDVEDEQVAELLGHFAQIFAVN